MLRPVDDDRAVSLVQAPTFVQIQSSSKSSLINPYHHNPSNSFNQTQSLTHNPSVNYNQSPGQPQSFNPNQSINHVQGLQPPRQSPFVQQRHLHHPNQSSLQNGHMSSNAQIRSSNSHSYHQGYQANPENHKNSPNPSHQQFAGGSHQQTPYQEQRTTFTELRDEEIERRSMRTNSGYFQNGPNVMKEMNGRNGINGYTNHGMNPSESVNSLRELNYPPGLENTGDVSYSNPGVQDTRSLPVYPQLTNPELRETHSARMNPRVQGSRPSPSPRPSPRPSSRPSSLISR